MMTDECSEALANVRHDFERVAERVTERLDDNEFLTIIDNFI